MAVFGLPIAHEERPSACSAQRRRHAGSTARPQRAAEGGLRRGPCQPDGC
jgi:hypothetical protein